MSFLFGRKKKEKELGFLREQEMKEYGLYVHTGRQLELRLDKLEELTNVIHRDLQGKNEEEKIQDLLKKINEVDKLIREIGFAWLSAGSDRQVSISMDGYEGLYWKALDICYTLLEDLRGRRTEEQTIIFLSLQGHTWRWYFKNALWLKDNSFFDKHVTPTTDKAMVVQAQQQFGYGAYAAPAPTSAGRISETQVPREDEYFPETMSSQIKPKREDEEE